MQHRLSVNGTTLYVDDLGDPDAPALLYIHGGPGNPCWDFTASVGDLLGRQLRVIAVDQRGIFRSDPLPDDPPLTVDVLVEDFEAVRRALGVERWTILGHSAGGVYALAYALAHPQAVRAVVFDCPCFDLDATDRHRLPVAADRLDSLGRTEAADRCRTIAGSPGRIDIESGSLDAMLALGEHYLDLFFPDARGRAAYERVMSLAPALDTRGVSHLSLLPAFYADRRPDLARLSMPSLLVRGTSDLVTPPEMIQDFVRATGGSVHTFEAAGHFAFVEQPDEYAAVVSRFVLASA